MELCKIFVKWLNLTVEKFMKKIIGFSKATEENEIYTEEFCEKFIFATCQANENEMTNERFFNSVLSNECRQNYIYTTLCELLTFEDSKPLQFFLKKIKNQLGLDELKQILTRNLITNPIDYIVKDEKNYPTILFDSLVHGKLFLNYLKEVFQDDMKELEKFLLIENSENQSFVEKYNFPSYFDWIIRNTSKNCTENFFNPNYLSMKNDKNEAYPDENYFINFYTRNSSNTNNNIEFIRTAISMQFIKAFKLILSKSTDDNFKFEYAKDTLHLSLNEGCLEILEELVYFVSQKFGNTYNDFKNELNFPLNHLTFEDIEILHSGNFSNLRMDLKLHMQKIASGVIDSANSMQDFQSFSSIDSEVVNRYPIDPYRKIYYLTSMYHKDPVFQEWKVCDGIFKIDLKIAIYCYENVTKLKPIENIS